MPAISNVSLADIKARGTQDQCILHRVGRVVGGPLRLTELFGGQIFNDVYMMNLTLKTPEWVNTRAELPLDIKLQLVKLYSSLSNSTVAISLLCQPHLS